MNSNNISMKKSPDDNNRTIAIVVAVLAVIALLLCFFLLRGCDGSQPEVEGGSGIIYDDTAVEGGWAEIDTDKIVESLNEKVQEGMINISMNTSPSFKSGTAKGNLMIVNEEINRYPQVVEITRNDTEELIYKSGAIPVGSKVEQAQLSVDLPKGSYDCTAMFYNVDPETGSYLGCAGAVINISVLN